MLTFEHRSEVYMKYHRAFISRMVSNPKIELGFQNVMKTHLCSLFCLLARLAGLYLILVSTCNYLQKSCMTAAVNYVPLSIRKLLGIPNRGHKWILCLAIPIASFVDRGNANEKSARSVYLL